MCYNRTSRMLKFMKMLKSFEETIKYYELLMVRDLVDIDIYPLPKGFSFVFWDKDDCLNDWLNIHLSTGEFNSIPDAISIFHKFYDKFYDQLPYRCVFIENKKGEKIATATISPAKEFGYDCVIDWFAVSAKAQGQKLSKPLLSKILIVAKNLGYKKILLHTQTTTWLAAKIYLDFGFKPYKTRKNKGWNILKTITDHPSLKRFKKLKEEDIYDSLLIKIKSKLDKLHSNYTYSVYYINGRNDVFVKEREKYFEYKYQLKDGDVILIKQKQKQTKNTSI